MTEDPSRFNHTKVVRSATLLGSTLVLKLHGELDPNLTPTMYEEVTREVASWDGPVVLDMTGVSFLESSGIGCLLRLRNDSVGTSRTINLRNVEPNVRRILVVTGLYDDLVAS
jgi:anti-sigma B factor antagonist